MEKIKNCLLCKNHGRYGSISKCEHCDYENDYFELSDMGKELLDEAAEKFTRHTVKYLFDVNDNVWYIEPTHWDAKNQVSTDWVVEKYRIRSISLSCNSKGEWKKSYRAQLLKDNKTTDYGFNFNNGDINMTVFLDEESAKQQCDERNKNFK